MSWAERRRAVAAEEARAADAARLRGEAEALAEIEALEDAEALEQLGLPDPDTLEPGSDFSAFMGKLVPGRLRARALRRLWGTNPVLANLDALVEYGEDYTDAATVVENMATTYEVGKGMLKHVERLAAKAQEDAPAGERDDAPGEEPAVVAALAEDGASRIEIPDQVRGEEPLAPAPEPGARSREEVFDEDVEAAPLPPRRMRFAVPA